ncbi:hypothetical protein A1A1_14879 [Planococcus antarcticus DSM 14505]|uniref:Uncharacterized protein n=1 Tax=Planococcus antarcticus DSM 14505 TaxID=1185653 RepID=A0A1C7DHL2_9BACL|nr:hypothetical protein BBH88_12500 [Planococcus antarcticus DSM 14505]EIM05694.1 hypothetical protein A1A1_14879 [Planococcus antarcticus DSM 14505]
MVFILFHLDTSNRTNIVFWNVTTGAGAERSQMTFNLFSIQVYIFLFPVIIDLLICMPKFMLQRKKEILGILIGLNS